MLEKNATGLIIIDVQGKLAQLVEDSDQVIANCSTLARGAQILGMPIIWLEQTPDKLGPTVDKIASVIEGLSPIEKSTFSAYGESKFRELIQSFDTVKTWLMCGIETHICVYQTALQLKAASYDIQVVNDCTSSRTINNKQLGISRLASSGVNITGLEMCLYELVADSKAPEFKQVLRLIK